MAPDPTHPILVINSGSSSLKFGLMTERDGQEQIVLDGSADGIGAGRGKFELRTAEGRMLRSANHYLASQGEALEQASQWLAEFFSVPPCAIGHRVVHGGPHLTAHQRITPSVRAQMQASLHFAPLHIPVALQLIDKAAQSYPGIPQFACFDTTFHNTLPESAARFPLPHGLFDDGIRRYGFHGLSYESIVHQLGAALPGRTIVAHLGNGASLAAIRNGLSVDTSMGLTPAGGIPMATRSGDLDPGVLLYLLRARQVHLDALEEMLNLESGLTALSGGRQDMRDLQAAAESGDRRAQLAIDVFCIAISKTIAAYASVLGGLDLLVFTGGIGEHSAQVRQNVCRRLEFLDLALDDDANQSHARTLTTASSRIRAGVVPSRENSQIARLCRAMMRNNDPGG
jgi:acetate kinase